MMTTLHSQWIWKVESSKDEESGKKLICQAQWASGIQKCLIPDLMLCPLYHNMMAGDVLEWLFDHAWQDAQKMWLSPGSCQVRALRWDFQGERWATTSHCRTFTSVRHPGGSMAAPGWGQWWVPPLSYIFGHFVIKTRPKWSSEMEDSNDNDSNNRRSTQHLSNIISC